jgi:hypothetical protein
MSPPLVLFSVLITGPLTQVDLTGYTADGLVPVPGPGQLSSNEWLVTGMNDGDSSFGGTFDEGDFAEGASNGGVTGDGTGGLWAFSTTPGDPAFGFQQTADDLTPGRIFLRFLNASGVDLVDPTVRFEVWTFNDSTRSSELEFAWSLDGGAFVTEGSLLVLTPELADPTPAWELAPRSVVLGGVTIPPGHELMLRWSPDNHSGSGGFDELAIDDIEIEQGGGGGGGGGGGEPDAGVDPGPDDGEDPGGADAGTDEPADGGGGYRAGCDAGGGTGGGLLLLALAIGLPWARRANPWRMTGSEPSPTRRA